MSEHAVNMVMHTSGHAAACMLHVIDDAAFSGEPLHAPDTGSERPNSPVGDVGRSYDSRPKMPSQPTEKRRIIRHDHGRGATLDVPR